MRGEAYVVSGGDPPRSSEGGAVPLSPQILDFWSRKGVFRVYWLIDKSDDDETKLQR